MNIRQLTRKAIIELASPLLTAKNGVYILNGHSAYKGDVSDHKAFSLQLNILRKKYEFIDFNEALRLIEEKDSAIYNEKLIAFTFDDGFSDCFTHIAPILNEFDVNACFFINSAFVESHEEYQEYFTLDRVNNPSKKPMSWSQVKELDKSGFVIGNHTKDHLRLSELSDKDFYNQVQTAHDKIELILGKKCEHFAWPYGALSDINESQVILLESIYKYIFSSANYNKYFSFDGRVINRRHFEPFWPSSHVHYFLSKGKSY